MKKRLDSNYHRGYLKRRRICQMLQPDQENPIVTVVADSGYGKTKAMLDFVAEQEAPVIWITFSVSDNYPVHFWENWTNTLSPVSKVLCRSMEKSGFPEDIQATHYFVKIFLREVYRYKGVIMVLDDFHLIENEKVATFIHNLVLLQVENLYTYILSRSKVLFLEKTGSIRQINEKDLMFTRDEMEAYFAQKNLNVSYEFILDCYQKTQGWPCAVNLISMSLEKNMDYVDQFFSLPQYLVFEAFDQQVFSQYTHQGQIFLVKLSLLEFYPRGLIDDVLSSEMEALGEKILSNVFIRYNRHTQTFQVHQMFRDFLITKTDLLSADEQKQLYLSFARWFEMHSLILIALQCYQKAESYGAIWKIIKDLIPGYYASDFIKMIYDIIDAFPEKFKDEHPQSYAIQAMLWMSRGELKVQKEWSEKIITRLKARPASRKNEEAIGTTYISLALCEMIVGNKDFKDYFKLAYDYLQGPCPIYSKPYLFLLNGNPVTMSDGHKGEIEDYIQALVEAEPYYSILLGGSLDGFAVLVRAMFAFYKGDFSHSEEYTMQVIYNARKNQQADLISCAYFILMRLAIVKGDYYSAMKALNKIQYYEKIFHAPVQLYVSEIARGWFFSKLRVKEMIPDWIIHEKVYMMKEYTPIIGPERLIKANCLLNDENYAELIPYLLESLQIYGVSTKFIYLILVHHMLAIAYYNTKKMDDAIREYYQVYKMSSGNHLVMLSAMFGRASRSMLMGLKQEKKTGKYKISCESKRLLAEIPDKWMDLVCTKAATYAKRVGMLREHYLERHREQIGGRPVLTRHEVVILSGVCDGLTREELADHLGLSVNTVKSMLNLIYSKLGAVNSAHAVRIATMNHIL